MLCYTSFLTGLESKQGWEGLHFTSSSDEVSECFFFLFVLIKIGIGSHVVRQDLVYWGPTIEEK